jgi:flagellar motor switch protein FliN/FliY
MGQIDREAEVRASESVAVADPPPGPDPEGGGRYPNLDKLLNIELPVIVVLAEKTATLREILSFAEGSLIVFKKGDSEPLDILVNDRRVGAGKTIKVDERFGVHVREIGSPEETLKRLR